MATPLSMEGAIILDGIHRLLAYAVVALTGAGICWSLLLVAAGRVGGPAFERFQAAVVAALIVAAASGLVLMTTGARPADGLHVLYAAVAVALVPLARSFVGRWSARRTSGLLLAAFAVLGAVVFRLFTTG